MLVLMYAFFIIGVYVLFIWAHDYTCILSWIMPGYEAMVAKTAGMYSVGDTITMADICLVPQLYNAQR